MLPSSRRNGCAGLNPSDSGSSGGSLECGAAKTCRRESRSGSLPLRVRSLDEGMMTLEMLEDELSRPRPEDCALMRSIEGDVMVLGAGGKMGPTLARLARRAADEAGCARRRIFAVSRSGNERPVEGVEAICCDLLDRDQIARL